MEGESYCVFMFRMARDERNQSGQWSLSRTPQAAHGKVFFETGNTEADCVVCVNLPRSNQLVSPLSSHLVPSTRCWVQISVYFLFIAFSSPYYTQTRKGHIVLFIFVSPQDLRGNLGHSTMRGDVNCRISQTPSDPIHSQKNASRMWLRGNFFLCTELVQEEQHLVLPKSCFLSAIFPTVLDSFSKKQKGDWLCSISQRKYVRAMQFSENTLNFFTFRELPYLSIFLFSTLSFVFYL